MIKIHKTFGKSRSELYFSNTHIVTGFAEFLCVFNWEYYMSTLCNDYCYLESIIP